MKTPETDTGGSAFAERVAALSNESLEQFGQLAADALRATKGYSQAVKFPWGGQGSCSPALDAVLAEKRRREGGAE